MLLVLLSMACDERHRIDVPSDAAFVRFRLTTGSSYIELWGEGTMRRHNHGMLFVDQWQVAEGDVNTFAAIVATDTFTEVLRYTGTCGNFPTEHGESILLETWEESLLRSTLGCDDPPLGDAKSMLEALSEAH